MFSAVNLKREEDKILQEKIMSEIEKGELVLY
jgi:hypothetical protein